MAEKWDGGGRKEKGVARELQCGEQFKTTLVDK